MAATSKWNSLSRTAAALIVAAILSTAAFAQGPADTTSAPAKDAKVPDAPQPVQQAAAAQPAPKKVDYSKGVSGFPNVIAPFRSITVSDPAFANAPRLETLVRDGKLYLSMNDAIALALENNLDIAIARYNLQIADTDILLSRAGGSLLGTPTGVVSGTPGGTSAASGGTGAGGTSAGAGGAGAGSAGLVLSTAGAGSSIPQFDPSLNGTIQVEKSTALESNTIFTGTTDYTQTVRTANFNYNQGFAPGTSMSVGFDNSRSANNSALSNVNPSLSSSFRATVNQHLLQGFGIKNNTRLIITAKNNKKITESSFKQQIIATITQIQDIYWDLVSAYEDVRVKERSIALAVKTLDDDKKQVEIGTLAPITVVQAQSDLAGRQQDLIVSQTNLQLQQTFMVNALSRTMANPKLATLPVVPTDTMEVSPNDSVPAVEDMVVAAQKGRPELFQAHVDLENREINKKATRNALLPTLDVYAFYGGSGLGGITNPAIQCAANPCTPAEISAGKLPIGTFPNGYGGTFANLFNSTAPDKGVGVNMNISIRNRAAQAEQIRSDLEYLQAELRLKQQENTINIDVRNTLFTFQQNKARVDAAIKARDYAAQNLDAEQKKYSLGASTTTLVLGAQRDLTQAESNVVAAQAAYQKSKVDLDRAVGRTMEQNNIAFGDAVTGNVTQLPIAPNVVPAKSNK